MGTYSQDVKQWTITNKMQINYTKTKEMVLGRLASDPPPLLSHGTQTIQRVTQFKLLSLIVSSDLQWEPHINYISSKASRKVYFLKQLELSANDLTLFYKSVVRP